MPELILNKDYKSLLTLRQTEEAIKLIKDHFERTLARELNLQRVSAPLFVKKGTGINDDLNGVERKAAFRIKDAGDCVAECLFSLAKWKRLMLAEYGFAQGEGLYTDMNAIRPDEEVLDNLHSVYVDQWDWERVIRPEERNLAFLKKIVKKIYKVLRKTEALVYKAYPQIISSLPEKIQFVHSEDLLEMFPGLSPPQREDKITEKYGAVFIIGIGNVLARVLDVVIGRNADQRQPVISIGHSLPDHRHDAGLCPAVHDRGPALVRCQGEAATEQLSQTCALRLAQAINLACAAHDEQQRFWLLDLESGYNVRDVHVGRSVDDPGTVTVVENDLVYIEC